MLVPVAPTNLGGLGETLAAAVAAASAAAAAAAAAAAGSDWRLWCLGREHAQGMPANEQD